MITEKFQLAATFRGKRSTTKSRRYVEITGKDLPAFAAVLRTQAEEASAKGDSFNALRLRNLAHRVERARKFTVNVPLEAKLGKSEVKA